MDNCVMDYAQGKVKLNRKTFTGSKAADKELLEALAMKKECQNVMAKVI
ncbi:hypothetical protein [Pedobacter sp. NJ-S-72]